MDYKKGESLIKEFYGEERQRNAAMLVFLCGVMLFLKGYFGVRIFFGRKIIQLFRHCGLIYLFYFFNFFDLIFLKCQKYLFIVYFSVNYYYFKHFFMFLTSYFAL